MKGPRSICALAALAALAGSAATAQGQALEDAPEAASPVAGKVALLLPDTKASRYETADRPYFEARLKELAPNVQVIYGNAGQDSNLQLWQAEAALAQGAQVLVLDPVDSTAAGIIAERAKARGVPVIAYDRLIKGSDGVDYHVSFDGSQVGRQQAAALVDKLREQGVDKPVIVMIDGAPAGEEAGLLEKGAHSVFDPLVQQGQLVIAKEYQTPGWSPDQAQNEMEQALAALGNRVDGVYCADDALAGGALAAMRAAGLTPLPPVTGQNAELTAIQRILAGEQFMTIYRPIQPEANAAAELAFDLLTQKAPDPRLTRGRTVNNGKASVPAVLLQAIVVTKDNVIQTVVKDGFWSRQQLGLP